MTELKMHVHKLVLKHCEDAVIKLAIERLAASDAKTINILVR